MGSKTKPSESLEVVDQCHPLIQKEKTASHELIMTMDVKLGQMTLQNFLTAPGELSKTFPFDILYDASSKQADLYNKMRGLDA